MNDIIPICWLVYHWVAQQAAHREQHGIAMHNVWRREREGMKETEEDRRLREERMVWIPEIGERFDWS